MAFLKRREPHCDYDNTNDTIGHLVLQGMNFNDDNKVVVQGWVGILEVDLRDGGK